MKAFRVKFHTGTGKTVKKTPLDVTVCSSDEPPVVEIMLTDMKGRYTESINIDARRLKQAFIKAGL